MERLGVAFIYKLSDSAVRRKKFECGGDAHTHTRKTRFEREIGMRRADRRLQQRVNRGLILAKESVGGHSDSTDMRQSALKRVERRTICSSDTHSDHVWLGKRIAAFVDAEQIGDPDLGAFPCVAVDLAQIQPAAFRARRENDVDQRIRGNAYQNQHTAGFGLKENFEFHVVGHIVSRGGRRPEEESAESSKEDARHEAVPSLSFAEKSAGENWRDFR